VSVPDDAETPVDWPQWPAGPPAPTAAARRPSPTGVVAMRDDPERAAWALVDAVQRGDFERAEDAALAALGRVRKARAEGIAESDASDGRAVRADGGQSMGGMDHTRQAYHRDLDYSIRSALRVARIDQRSLYPATIGQSEWMDGPTDYFGTVCWLVGDATYQRFRDIEQQVAEEGEPVERKLSDFGGGASA